MTWHHLLLDTGILQPYQGKQFCFKYFPLFTMWYFKISAALNLFPQVEHTWAFSIVWAAIMCLLRLPWSLNSLSQRAHRKRTGFWTCSRLKCFPASPARRKVLSQPGHVQGCRVRGAVVCMFFTWTRKFSRVVYSFWQTRQEGFGLSLWTSRTWMNNLPGFLRVFLQIY